MSFICARARSCGVPARFMVVVVGLPPRLPLAMRWVGALLPLVRGDGSLLVAAAMDALGLW